MAATSLFFNGRLNFRPGSYSEVDTSALEAVGLGASGRVAIIGTAEGGKPVSQIDDPSDLLIISNPSLVTDTFRSGDLREAGNIVFAPTSDPEIQAGAQQMVALKVNPSTAGSVTLANANGDSVDIEAADFGEFTNQISIEISDGTAQGKLVTVTFEDTVQSADNVAGDSQFSLLYRSPTGVDGEGWDTLTAEVTSTGLNSEGTKDMAGLDADITAQGAAQIELVSANAADTTQTAVVYGLVGGAPTREEVQLNGTTVVTTNATFDASGVFAVQLDAVAAGDIDVSDGTATILTVTAGTVAEGGIKAGAMFATEEVNFELDAAGTESVWIDGRNTSNIRILERIALTGTTPVSTTATNFSKIEFIVLGEIPAARTVSMSASAAKSTHSAQNTLLKLAEFYNGKQDPNSTTPAEPYGFTLTLKSSTPSLDPAELDLSASPVNALSPAEPDFYADLFFFVDFLNTNISLITASKASGADGLPDNTTSPVFLSGGSEGTATFAEWQKALNLLKRLDVNTIVPLTTDPAVHAAVKAHCEFMGGAGRSERDALVGTANAAQTGLPTKDELKQQIVDLNSRHIRVCGQSMDRFNTSGERQTFTSPFVAVAGAGMQAGSTVGESLTNKLVNCLKVSQDTSWNPLDDADELIAAGAFFMEEIDGVGRRWVRNVTSHLSSSNIAFTEASVNEAVNFSTKNFRENMEVSVGKKGFSGTINAAKGVAINTLGLLVDQNILVAYRNLDISLDADVLSVSVEIAPVIPINFVRNVLHLVTVQQTA